MADEFGMSPSEIVENHSLRSQYMQRLIVAPPGPPPSADAHRPPRLLVQFWDDIDAVPLDVQECLDSWSALDSEGFTRLLFDDASAAKFIETHFDERHMRAFQKCQHPAMRSDYFRYAFISTTGGFYVDADDVFLDKPVDALLNEGWETIAISRWPLSYRSDDRNWRQWERSNGQ